jgi:hypothetical protein
MLGPLERANRNHCWCSLVFRIPDDGQSLKPSNSDDYDVFQIAPISDFGFIKLENCVISIRKRLVICCLWFFSATFISFFPICFIFNLYGDRF